MKCYIYNYIIQIDISEVFIELIVIAKKQKAYQAMASTFDENNKYLQAKTSINVNDLNYILHY